VPILTAGVAIAQKMSCSSICILGTVSGQSTGLYLAYALLTCSIQHQMLCHGQLNALHDCRYIPYNGRLSLA
jgi:hypothetical protein